MIDLQPVDLSPLVARVAELAAWSGDRCIDADRPVQDWQCFIAGHVFGSARVTQVDAEALLTDIARTLQPERIKCPPPSR